MDPAVGELPDEPCVNRAEQQLSPLGFFARTGDIVQNPFDLLSQTTVVSRWFVMPMAAISFTWMSDCEMTSIMTP